MICNKAKIVTALSRVLFPAVLILLCPPGARGEEFLRVARDSAGNSAAMESAIVTYALPGSRGVTVDLIAAVHVAEPGYYEALNRRFEKYDAVLYELIAEEGHAVPIAGEKPENIVSAVQTGIK